MGLEGEKPWHRAACYISEHGYMDLHIKHNRIALEKWLPTEDIQNRTLLFADFGCGPMTAGLVLAEKLSKITKSYRDKVSYLGVDCSENMCNFAKTVNGLRGDGNPLFSKFQCPEG